MVMDWKQVENDFAEWHLSHKGSKSVQAITEWFKNRIEPHQSVPPLTEDERSEFYTSNLTAEVKPKYNV